MTPFKTGLLSYRTPSNSFSVLVGLLMCIVFMMLLSACAPAEPSPTALRKVGEFANSGRAVFAAQCARCHGAVGQGLVGPALIGAGASLERYRTAKTLYDFISQAMPFSAPGTLTRQEYEQVTAYLILQNNMAREADPFDASKLESLALVPEKKATSTVSRNSNITPLTNFVFHIVLLGIAVYSGYLARFRRELMRHCNIMKVAVILLILSTGLVMVPSLIRYTQAGFLLTSLYVELYVHAAMGLAVIGIWIYANLALSGVISMKRRLFVPMIIAFGLWVGAFILGTHVYSLIWIPPS